MGFEFIDLQPPSLPLISTRRAGGGDADGSAGECLRQRGEEADEHCVTPKSATAKPEAALLPPPPPRKPRPVKRKLAPPPEGFFPVPTDLAALFVPVPQPATRRIRV
ncbi:hypothetical protein ZIOFF_023697 [Zingiber officinale]|uniref:Uncharacterized protein n=1 Tax=Zingiber officinale TaxID=94328 RepID=A0A8J5GX54_ZINOF|nr:hypothetical protein ZIOFF_023697 [Zingiber officinale]